MYTERHYTHTVDSRLLAYLQRNARVRWYYIGPSGASAVRERPVPAFKLSQILILCVCVCVGVCMEKWPVHRSIPASRSLFLEHQSNAFGEITCNGLSVNRRNIVEIATTGFPEFSAGLTLCADDNYFL